MMLSFQNEEKVWLDGWQQSRSALFFFNLFKKPTYSAKCDHFIMVSFTKQESEEALYLMLHFPN